MEIFEDFCMKFYTSQEEDSNFFEKSIIWFLDFMSLKEVTDSNDFYATEALNSSLYYGTKTKTKSCSYGENNQL